MFDKGRAVRALLDVFFTLLRGAQPCSDPRIINRISFKRHDVMKKTSLSVLALLVILAVPSAALASSIVVSLGNTAPTNPFAGGAALVSGNVYGSAVISSNFVAPF